MVSVKIYLFILVVRISLKNISFMINKGDKIGLTGKNAAGKINLLKLLANEQSPNHGSISVPNGIIVGYLMQDH